jgi:hypothetical protein
MALSRGVGWLPAGSPDGTRSIPVVSILSPSTVT